MSCRVMLAVEIWGQAICLPFDTVFILFDNVSLLFMAPKIMLKSKAKPAPKKMPKGEVMNEVKKNKVKQEIKRVKIERKEVEERERKEELERKSQELKEQLMGPPHLRASTASSSSATRLNDEEEEEEEEEEDSFSWDSEEIAELIKGASRHVRFGSGPAR